MGGAASSAWANSSLTYKVQEREVYDVVVKSDRAETDLEPGIYRIDPKTGSPSPMLLGEVLEANRYNRGIVGYVGRVNGQRDPHEILAVINNRLTLLNQNSKAADPLSFKVVGGVGKSALPVADLIHGTPVSLPEISSLDDISVFVGPLIADCQLFPNGGRVVLFSLRSHSPWGDGLTLAMLLEWGTADSRVSVREDKAWVIGHKFLDESALKRIFPSNTIRMAGQLENGVPVLPIYAPLVVTKFKNQLSRLSDNPIAKGWTEQISRFEGVQRDGLKQVEGVLHQDELFLGVPAIDLVNRTEILSNTPIERVFTETERAIGQTFDPSSSNFRVLNLRQSKLHQVKVGKRDLYFLPTREIESATIGTMPIDRDPKTGNYLIIPEYTGENKEAPRYGGEAYIYFSNGTPVVLSRNGEAKNEFQTLPLKQPLLNPSDNISFLRRHEEHDGRFYQVLVIQKKRERAERSEIFALGLLEAENLQVSFSSSLYDGPAMSPKEMSLRLVEDGHDLLFDKVSPVRGVSAYLKFDKGEEAHFVKMENLLVPKKTVPYERVLGALSGADQVYLRSLSEKVLVDGFLYHREFNSTGAIKNHSGFYLLSKSEEAKKRGDYFLQGHPLFSSGKAKDKKRYVAQTKVLQSDSTSHSRFPPIQVSLIPYTEKLPRTKKDKSAAPQSEAELLAAGSESSKENGNDVSRFRMAVAFTPAVELGSGSRVDGVVKDFDIHSPYKSLAYSQVIQGYKGRSNEFYVLLITKQDDTIKGSSDGVLVSHGVIRWSSSGGVEGFHIDMTDFKRVHKGPVPPGSVKAHLMMDAQGSYFWVEDPSAEKDSPKYRVRKLSRPGEIVDHRMGHVLQLREPDHLKETEMGFVSDRNRFGGRWEVYTTFGLTDAVPGFREHLDKLHGKPVVARKDKKVKGAHEDEVGDADDSDEEVNRGSSKADERAENVLIDAFEKYLDEMVTPGSPDHIRGPRVLVVEPALKEKFKLAFFTKLADGVGPMSLLSNKISYYHANASLDDVEISEELHQISSPRKDRQRLLYVDSDILKVKEVDTRDKDAEKEADETEDEWASFMRTKQEPSIYPFASIEQNQKASILVLMASGGRAKSVKGWKKLKSQNSRVPMLSIVTPQEWREIQSAHGKEVAAGVLDQFETNYDFLTSSWTVWPPKTEKSPDDIKALARIPYKSEEMRVFPTLDRLLNDAANGNLAGQQKIIIVPQELKTLVQKLIMLRWATSDSSAGAWNYSNRKLALHKVLGTNNFQNVVQDNFKAMSGAAHTRHSVFYSDLESIIRIGRPYTPATVGGGGYGFRIRDPILGSKGFLMESEAKLRADSDSVSPELPLSIAQNENENDEDEDLVELEDVWVELENVTSQINTMTTELENLERRRRAVGPDKASLKAIDESSASLQNEVAFLKTVRGVLEKRLESFDDVRPVEGKQEDLIDDRGPIRRVTEKTAFPHMMWWIAAEGQSVQPRKKAGWSLKKAVERHVATILVGTEDELHRLETDMSFENKFFDLREHFEVVHLEAPDEQTKFQLVEQLFERPEVSSLGIRFALENDVGRDPRSQLIYHFINRIDQVAYDEKIEPTAAFVRAFIALKTALSEDLELRRHRLIDEKFIERLFTKVFPMPLKPEILEPTDPLNRLRDQDQSVRDLQAVGYEGSPDLKRRFFETILSQTRPTDTSRPIPNSQILFGGTSTGKTFLLESLFKMLNLVEYNPTRASNEEADFIIIKVQKLTADDTSDPDKMTVKEAITQVMDLMAQPKGVRAHIVFDDFHKATSKAVREKLSQFIAALFEAKNGMYVVKSKDGKRHREIPVQNLNIYMTINPAANERIRKEWVKESLRGSELLKREVLAALSGDGFTPEESFLARWGDIINLDNFPRSAKVPELVKRVRANAGKSGQMVLVDPQVIDNLIDRFPHAHARELLSPATAALTSLPSSAAAAPMYLVSLRDRPLNHSSTGSSTRAESFSQHELQHEVRKFTQVDTIRPGDVHSLVRLMGFAMRNFRLHVLNYVALEAHMSDILRVNVLGQNNVLKNNFLLGLATHVLEHPRVPTAEIVIRPEQFGFMGRTQLEDLVKYQATLKGSDDFFPINLELQDRRDEMDLETFRKGTYALTDQPKTRRDVLIETVAKAEVILRKGMRIYMRLKSEDDLRDIGQWNETRIKEWFHGLSEKEPEAEFREVSRELIELFFDFIAKLHSPDLVNEKGERVTLHLYDQVRLFAYVLDKAIVHLPWGQIGNFAINTSNMASDMSLGTRTGFREYVGTHQLSLFSMATPEFMNDMLIQATSGSGESLAGRVKDLKEHFSSVCASLLVSNKAREQ